MGIGALGAFLPWVGLIYLLGLQKAFVQGLATHFVIQDALLDDALAYPSAGAWERLRQVIIERQMKNYGMWVLDEPQHDPPEAPPMLLNGHDFERALRIYGNYLTNGSDLRRNVIWSGLSPTFSVLVNW